MTAYFLNIADLLCTFVALAIGAEEMNPLLQDIRVMIFVKVFVIGFLCWWVQKKSAEYKIARRGLILITIVYAFLLGYHIVWLTYILIV